MIERAQVETSRKRSEVAPQSGASTAERRPLSDAPVILLVDDVPANLLALEGMLRRTDVQILTATSGAQALELLLEWDVALAVIDVQMPEMDGFQLASLMRGVERTRCVPIIFVTASARDEVRVFKAYETGAVDFLFKPIEPRILRGKVDVFVMLEKQRRALETSEQRFRSLAQAMSCVVWQTSPRGVITEDSVAWPEYTGQSLDEAREHTWLEAVHAHDRDRVTEVWNRALVDRKPIEIECRLRRSDGHFTWTVFRAAPVIDHRGRLAEWACQNIDIQVRKDAEQREAELHARVAASEVKFRRLYECGMIGVLFFGTDGRIVEANDAFLELVGQHRHELEAGRVRLDRLIPDFDAFHQNVRTQTGERGAFAPTDTEIVHQDGHTVAVVIGGAVVPDQDQVIAFVLDVSEHKHAERLREMFIGILGHDLRNPLGATMMAVESVRRRESDATTLKALDLITSSGVRMNRMVEQLLDITRFRLGGGIALALCRADLRDLVDQATNELLNDRHRFRVEAIGDSCGLWDPDRLLQVVANLVANAIRHAPPSGSVTIRIDGSSTDTVELLVRNGGPAIPEELRDVLFEPFRGSTIRYRTGLGGGLGLGLFITKQLVDAHGGTIGFETSDERGTCFVVRFPREARPAAKPSRAV